MQINGSVALVTGGASGLGEAVSRRFSAGGAAVVICDLKSDRGSDLAAQLGRRAFFIQADVTKVSGVEAAIKTALDRFGGLHITVSCAGILAGAKILGKHGPHELKRFRTVVETNLIGTFNVMRLAAEAMAQNQPMEDGERGVIVNTASIAAFEGQIGQAAYAASKAGVVGLTLPAARELAAWGVRVCTIAPGTFDTPMLAGLPPKAMQSLTAQIPFPSRLGHADEFAALAQHIVENRFLSGETIRLDGALRMGPR